MPTEFFYTQNGQPAPTPVPADQLRQLASSGQLVPTDMVWKEGMPAWLPAATVKGLFPARPLTGEMPAATPANLEKAGVKGPGSNTRLADQPASPAAAPRGPSPFEVLLLNCVTAGIYGLVYALRQSSGPAKATSLVSTRQLGTLRHPVRVPVLSLLTLGIYLAWWAHVVLRECASYLDRRDLDSRAELALMFAFPPYTIYVVAFTLPALVRQVRTRAGLPEVVSLGNASQFASLTGLLFIPFLAMAIQEALNEVWSAGR